MTQQASGFTTDYTDPGTGINLPQAWIQIKNMNYFPYGYVNIAWAIYKDLASKEAGMGPVFDNFQHEVSYGSPDWDGFFDPSVMDIADHNIQLQSVSWLQENIQNLHVTHN